jgi:hypothetical protein
LSGTGMSGGEEKPAKRSKGLRGAAGCSMSPI